ncbi:tRNA synthetases class I (M)-domain-containing protein, partial [Cercophora samala]
RVPVLPDSGERNILITSALPYVNNVPHLGNIIGSVLSADAFARYGRGRGFNTLYIGGTDEYGTTTEARALVENCTPQELCDKYHAVHAQVYEWFNISFDFFGRTTTPLQTQITQDIFLKLKDNGFLEERMTTQLYCEKHQSFLADRFVEGECPECGYIDARGDQCDLCGKLLESLELIRPRCKVDGSVPVTKDTKHIFLELDKLQPEVEAFFQESAAKGAWSSNGVSITAAWLKEGLQPRSITRDLKWGTPVPASLEGYEEKVIYSWFDAWQVNLPIGYISITANYTSQWEKWWRNPDDVQLYQFMGKDNVVYHTIIFPASKIGTRDPWTKLHHLSTTDYLTYEGGKFSKSRGIGVFGDSAKETEVPSDIWRFYLLYCRPETGDSEFTWDGFISANNNLLLKNLGNFVNRVIKFVNSRHFNSVVPDWTQHNEPSFDAFKQDINQLLAQYIRELDSVKLRAGLLTTLQISQRGNGFLQANKLDNSLRENEPAKCAALLRADALPILEEWSADSIRPGHEIGLSQHLFSRIKPEKAEEWREKYGSEEAKKVKEEEAALKTKKASKNKNKKKNKGAGVKKEGEDADQVESTASAESTLDGLKLD